MQILWRIDEVQRFTIIHETGELSEPKYYDIVERQKNKVEFQDVRGKHRGIFHYEREPAMASQITSLSLPIMKQG